MTENICPIIVYYVLPFSHKIEPNSVAQIKCHRLATAKLCSSKTPLI